jgi:hypothetical protein
VNFLTDIFVISLRIKTGRQKGHKQLILNLQKAISPRVACLFDGARKLTYHLQCYG